MFKWLKNGALCLSGILLGLLLTEGMARLCLPHPDRQINILRRRAPNWIFDFSSGQPAGYDPFLQRQPNSMVVCNLGDGPEKMNNYGFRDRDFSLQPAPGKIRVATLGDSYTEGWNVPRAKSFPKLLENKLSSQIEVLNFGLSCRSPIRYVYAYDKLVRSFHPQVVLVALFQNDPDDDHELAPCVTLDSRGVPSHFNFHQYFRTTPHEPRSKWEKRLDRWQWTACRFSRLFPYAAVCFINPERRRFMYSAATPEEFQTRWKESQKHLETLQRLTRADGAQLLCAYVPFCRPEFGRFCEDFCKERQIPFFMPSEFLQCPDQPSLYIPGDGHFSVKGNELYASELAAWFSKANPIRQAP
ncbi:MAG: hypothetical protein PHV34_12080 [Verrucomicrobiae bacterium]|nr:hypothetical protein [Verrucomicrobiae bacterium]